MSRLARRRAHPPPTPPLQGGALLCAYLLFTTPALAQNTTTSPAPEAVSISIYRAPDRDRDSAMVLANLRGFALVTETRRVSIPAGDGVIRFEGVASGILPESAIVTGLPEGVVEKNQDANLLSPASLLGAATAARVTLRRTSKATGAVREQDATIRSGPGGQVVLQTAEGFETLRCTGIPETIVYDRMPEGLSAKPTLSVRTTSTRAATVTVTLSYLADAFDWQANYVAQLSADGRSLDLFGWATLASNDETGFAGAQAAIVAGTVNRTPGQYARPYERASIDLTCWPDGTTTSDLGNGIVNAPPPAMMADMPAPIAMMARAESIVVTGSKRFVAQREDLGDLKLYRVPMPVTVASRAQKQVALLDRPRVPVRTVYRAEGDGNDAPIVTTVLIARNRTADGLGLPLPAGRVAVYRASGARMLLVGEGGVTDKAVGEDVEIVLAEATQVTVRSVETAKRRRTLTATNALPRAIALEVRLGNARGGGLVGRDGQAVWVVTVPANGSVSTDVTTE